MLVLHFSRLCNEQLSIAPALTGVRPSLGTYEGQRIKNERMRPVQHLSQFRNYNFRVYLRHIIANFA